MASWTSDSRTQAASLDTGVETDSEVGIECGALVEDFAVDDPQSHMDLVDMRSQLVDAVGQPEDRDRLVATFYCYEGLTDKELGKALWLSKGRISHVLCRALTELREHLEGSLLEHNEFGGRRTFLN